MKITKRKLVAITIAIIKEITISPKDIGIEFSKKGISVWFYNIKNEDGLMKMFGIYPYQTLKYNLRIFKKIVKEIRR